MKQAALPIKNNKKRNILFLVLLLFVIIGCKAYLDLFSSNVTEIDNKKELAIYIDQTRQLESVFYQLQNGGFLKNQASFERLARWIQLEEKLKSGKYLLKEGMNNAAIIKMLYKGRQQPVDVVFKYAERVDEIAGFFGKQLMFDSIGFYQLLTDTSYLNSLGFTPQTIVSFFIPNTYNFFWNTEMLSLMARMEKEYQQFWNAERNQLAKELGLTKIEVSTLASIVQKESNKFDEMPIIAGVYLNRMHAGMPLQADPTIIYAWNDKSIKRVTSFHTAIESPFNTYVHVGLPPGPICTPSIQAIDAVLHAVKHKYIYFCAKEDFSGYHVFASTFSQHLNNAARYQKALNKRNIH
jgi:UPF0755 protein